MTDVTPASTALERQIASQPDELARLLEQAIPHQTIEGIRQAHRIWLVGTGTSQHAAELGAMMLHEAGRAAQAMSSMHFVNWAPPIDPHDAVILISHNAGTETAYAGSAWSIALHAGMALVPITRRGGEMPGAIQTVAKETSHTYTVSYTAVLLLLARLAQEIGAEALEPGVLGRIPDAVRDAIANPASDAISPPTRLLVLSGEGPASVTAREGALKVREASRFPAEGYDVEYLLHGQAVPLSADDRLVVLTPPDTDGLVSAVAAAAEAEGVPVTRLHEPSGLPPLLAQIPLVVRLQLLALDFARRRGFDPDVAIERSWADERLWAIGSPEATRGQT
jgi:glucosamine--fructose-6-phosphate aminotransferase (isomerizing)